jgi:hypothetical protein
MASPSTNQVDDDSSPNLTLDQSNPPKLNALNSSITGNRVQASPDITPEGRGLWTGAARPNNRLRQ